MTLPYEIITCTADETEKVGEELARSFKQDASLPRFVAMFGDLGVGKTAFTRGFVRVLSPSSAVKSPTFAIVKEYPSADIPVYHFDMYRITDEDDLFSIGFDDYLARRGISIVEWSENIPYALPRERVNITIEKLSADTPDNRRITITIQKGPQK